MSNYCNINEMNEPHLRRLIDWIFQEVISSSGDGDALWYSRFYNINDILPILEEVNLLYEWKIEKHDTRITCWDNQEGFTITNNEEDWDNAPSWQQMMIKL